MRIAVEGCCHGELDDIYATIKEAQESDGKQVDLLLICGDFQAIRNYSDLQSLAVPEKYRRLGGFYKYYSGEAVAPLLTIVIGGNHEASNYMWELFHGGWLAHNIYYLGAAGSVLVNGLRISGASGIYKSGDYKRGRYERHPYDRSSIRSIYHTREYDIARLAQLAALSAFPTIFLSHDWPLEIEQYGDTAALIRRKPFFKEEIASNTLGSPPLRGLLEVLRPQYWFAAHLHVKFAALFKHNGERTKVQRHQHSSASNGIAEAQATNPDELVIDDDDEDATDGAKAETHALPSAETLIHPGQPALGTADTTADPTAPDESVDTKANGLANENPDEIAMDDDDEDEDPSHAATDDAAVSQPDGSQGQESTHANDGHPGQSASARLESGILQTNTESDATRFLALSKCLPGQDFLQIFDIDTPSHTESVNMTFDPVWLAITRAFHGQLSLAHQQPPLPAESTICKALIEKEVQWLKANVTSGGCVPITDIQQFYQTAPYPGQPGGDERGPGSWYTNPQTENLCQFLGLENKINPIPPELRAQLAATAPVP